MEKIKKPFILFIAIVICIFAVIWLIITFAQLLINNANKNEVATVIDTDLSKSKNISEEDLEIITKYDNYENNTYYLTMSTDEKKNVTTRIDTVLTQINERDYNTLYSKLDADYRNYKFPTQDKFEDYLSDLLGDLEDYTCEYFIAKSNGVRYALTSSNGNKVIMIIKDDENGDYSICFDADLINIEKYDEFSQLANMVFGYKKKINYNNNTSYVLEITNVSQKSSRISFKDINAKIIIGGTIKLVKADGEYESLIISPNETKTIEIQFNIGKDSLTPLYINVLCKIDGKEYEKDIQVDFPEPSVE